jgi:hypothetical protein
VGERLDLFHRIAHPPSARVRLYIVEHGLEGSIHFRNVEYADAAGDLARRGGDDVPALWDGQRLLQGAEAVLARLQRLVDIGRS